MCDYVLFKIIWHYHHWLYCYCTTVSKDRHINKIWANEYCTASWYGNIPRSISTACHCRASVYCITSITCNQGNRCCSTCCHIYWGTSRVCQWIACFWNKILNYICSHNYKNYLQNGYILQWSNCQVNMFCVVSGTTASRVFSSVASTEETWHTHIRTTQYYDTYTAITYDSMIVTYHMMVGSHSNQHR